MGEPRHAFLAGALVIGPIACPGNGAGSQVMDAPRASADPLSWHVVSSYSTRQIKNEYLPFTARGVYLIMDVAATNEGSQPVTVNADRIKLRVGQAEYPLNANGLAGLELAGHKPISGIDLRPARTGTGWVVFDVPSTTVTATAELCLDGQTCLPQGGVTRPQAAHLVLIAI